MLDFLLKKISIQILCKRKEYTFLPEKLKQKKVLIGGGKLEGVFTFKQQRFRLNPVQKNNWRRCKERN